MITTTIDMSGGNGGISPCRVEKVTPDAYRLARRKGELVLQGAYFWQEGSIYGHEWRDIPTVIVADSEEPVCVPTPCGCFTTTDGLGNKINHLCAVHAAVTTITTVTSGL